MHVTACGTKLTKLLAELSESTVFAAKGSKTGGSSKTMLFRVTESVTQIVKVACSALESLSLTKSALHLKRLTANETSRHDLKSSIPKVP